MPNREREERVQMMMAPEELAAIENFRFKHRIPTRAAALREILRRGLEAPGKVVIDGAKSRDFGVLRRHAPKLPKNN